MKKIIELDGPREEATASCGGLKKTMEKFVVHSSWKWVKKLNKEL